MDRRPPVAIPIHRDLAQKEYQKKLGIVEKKHSVYPSIQRNVKKSSMPPPKNQPLTPLI